MKPVTSFPELKTERLLLRKLKEKDMEQIIYLRSDAEVNKFVKRPKTRNKEEAIAFIEKISLEFLSGKSIYWVITEGGNDKMLGSICLWNFSEDGKTAELGYDLSPEFQGLGFMDEALKKVLNFAFDEMKFKKLEAYTQKNNIPSLRLLERNGFIRNSERTDPDNSLNIIFELRS